MTAKFFVDTNVLVYAASSAVADQARRDLALELLDRSDLALSAQVLAEFYSVATSKAKLNMAHDDAVMLLQAHPHPRLRDYARTGDGSGRTPAALPNQLLGRGHYRRRETDGLS